MKPVCSCLLFVVSCYGINAQVELIAEKEHLSIIGVGQGQDQVRYDSTEEMFFSPQGPIVSHDGNLLFFPNYINSIFHYFADGSFNTKTVPKNIPLKKQWNRNFDSQHGLSLSESGYMLIANKALVYIEYFTKRKDYFDSTENYITPWGVLFLAEDRKEALGVVFDVTKTDGSFELKETKELKAWLPTQPGGFSIGDDGKLYRNGMLWSAVPPPPGYWAERYAGKLMSGHNIWVGEGMHGQEKTICISNSQGDLELKMDIPWGYKPDFDPEIFRMFDYGVGPWGELYYLIAPKEYLNPQHGDVAELVVVRNHLKYFGRLNDKDVRLRDRPGTGGKVLGTFPAKTGFRILERSGKQETIGGQTSDWVKVRLLDGRVGWFFGAFVHNLYDGPNGLPPPWPNVADW